MENPSYFYPKLYFKRESEVQEFSKNESQLTF